jgi:hypothetical protein
MILIYFATIRKCRTCECREENNGPATVAPTGAPSCQRDAFQSILGPQNQTNETNSKQEKEHKKPNQPRKELWQNRSPGKPPFSWSSEPAKSSTVFPTIYTDRYENPNEVKGRRKANEAEQVQQPTRKSERGAKGNLCRERNPDSPSKDRQRDDTRRTKKTQNQHPTLTRLN